MQISILINDELSFIKIIMIIENFNLYQLYLYNNNYRLL